MSSFVRATPRATAGVVANPLPLGARRWLDGQSVVSTGHAALDAALGGGLPLGSLVLLEEDVGGGGHARGLAQLFAAEAIACGHALIVAGGDGRVTPAAFLESLPHNASRGSADAAAVAADAATRTVSASAHAHPTSIPSAPAPVRGACAAMPSASCPCQAEQRDAISPARSCCCGPNTDGATPDVALASGEPTRGLLNAWQYRKYLPDGAAHVGGVDGGHPDAAVRTGTAAPRLLSAPTLGPPPPPPEDASGTSRVRFCHTFDLAKRISPSTLASANVRVLAGVIDPDPFPHRALVPPPSLDPRTFAILCRVPFVDLFLRSQAIAAQGEKRVGTVPPPTPHPTTVEAQEAVGGGTPPAVPAPFDAPAGGLVSMNDPRRRSRGVKTRATTGAPPPDWPSAVDDSAVLSLVGAVLAARASTTTRGAYAAAAEGVAASLQGSPGSSPAVSLMSNNGVVLPSAPPPTATRIVLLGFGGPLWPGCLGTDAWIGGSLATPSGLADARVFSSHLPLLRAVTHIKRSLAQSAPASNTSGGAPFVPGIVYLCVSTWALPLAIAASLRASADAVIKVHAFGDPEYALSVRGGEGGFVSASASPTPSAFGSCTGVVLLRKLPAWGAPAPPVLPDTLTWVYTRAGGRLTIERPFTPVADAVEGAGGTSSCAPGL